MTATPRRLDALDAFRGIAVAAMILVNNPGNWSAVYAPLTHAPWNGCSFADLVFPSFLVIMGVALPWTIGRQRAAGADGASLARRVAVRALTLVAIGLLLNLVVAWPNLAALRFPGVLQRIALTYALAALIVWRARPPGQFVAAMVLLLMHAAVVVWRSEWLAIDQALFGRHALTATGDPEGLVGLAPSVATALLGAMAGAWMTRAPTPRATIAGLVLGGALAAVMGGLWSTVLPFNKFLWTGSFALFASGLALLALAACYAVMEAWQWRAWLRPFVWLGMNPLAIYGLSELTAHLLDRPWFRRGGALASLKDVLFWHWLTPLVGDNGGLRSSLIYATAYALLWLAVAALLQRRGITLRA